MRIGFRILALATAVALTACGEEGASVITEFEPDPTMVRVRVINATNVNIDFAAPTGDFVGHNTNISHGNSRCIEMAPGGAVRIRDFLTKTAYATPPTTTFAAGKSYSLLVYNPTLAANTVSYLTWQNEGQNTPPADSAGLAIVNVNSANTISTAGAFITGTQYTIVTAGTTNFVAVGAANNNVGTVFTATGAGSGTGTASHAGLLDVYVNPTLTTEPVLALANRRAIALPVGGMSPYFVVPGGTSTQVRLQRSGTIAITGATSGLILNSTHTVQEGQNTVWVMGIPSLTAATTQRSFTTGGC